MDGTEMMAGRVIAIRGAVVDVAFPGAPELPAINDALIIEDSAHSPVVVEVQAHLDASAVRAIALQATTGLRRGAPVRAVGGPLEVPVGDAVLGRLLDVTGAVGDKRG
ncbi:MAG TPA: F0F1 ATP synthase subunit beta, partial [Rhodobacterales bacterium]|nr:F0F1 ATP synthase subunit beta [Rhodobacterales bacterium]